MFKINCSSCQNFAKLNIVKNTGLCVACHNFEQWKLGGEYVCNYCRKSCLRVQGKIACDSCHGIFMNKNIPKIDLVNQSNYHSVINNFKGHVFRHNLNILKSIYKRDSDDVYMCDIPKHIINHIDNNGFCSEKDIIDII